MTTTDVDNWPADADGRAGPGADGALPEARRALRHRNHLRPDPHGEAQREAHHARSATRRPTPATRSSSPPAPRPCTWACPREQAFMGKGVSGCATCDGFFYKGQDVCVVGGGNTAVEEALYLSNIARHVTVIHRRDKFRAEKILQDKLLRQARRGQGRDRVEPHARRGAGRQVRRHRRAHQVHGRRRDQGAEGHRLLHRHRPQAQHRHLRGPARDEATATSSPSSGLEGNATATSVPGVFAAGDVQDHVYRQAVTSAGTGCMAALDADKYLESLRVKARPRATRRRRGARRSGALPRRRCGT